MEFFEVVEKRRSVRRFTEENVPDEVVQRALEAALLAPNSSNTQTWNFYWASHGGKKAKLVEYCLSQSAARTAQHLIVVTADPALWRRSQKPLADFVRSVNAPKSVILYYEKLVPYVYRWGFLNSMAPFKFLLAWGYGIFKPTIRGPYGRRDSQEVAVKSAALAAENFVLAVTAQGYATCMMEGFDERRVKRLLGLACSSRVVMVIGVGREGPKALWGPRFRIPAAECIHRV